MRHPFDGILPDRGQGEHDPSRREVLTWILGASAAPLALSAAAASAQEGDGEAAAVEAKPLGDYRLYFVVPRNVKEFNAQRRSELKVQGTYQPGLAGNDELKDKPGFLAWWGKEQAEAVAAAEDVATVHCIEPDDVAVSGTQPDKGAATLRVYAAPLDWNARPQADTYHDIEALGQTWQRQLGMYPNVKIVANKAVRTPFVVFEDGKAPDAAINAIKSHPQVYALQWMTPVAATTQRLGEEGGATTERVGEEGGVTTQAVGEEGATTLRVGEEGATTGALREEGAVTTRALGEEGGVPRPTTKALGEEGGSTEALGEEGGRPRPEPTTLALGEEGGRLTTQALGEEGGRGEAPAILPKDPPTTADLGEEGGAK